MRIQIKGFQIKPNEEQALKLANDRWLDFERTNRNFPRILEEPDRKAFTDLGKAAKQLQKALEPFVSKPTQPEMGRLVFLMQDVQLLAHQKSHYFDMVNALYEPLDLIAVASKIESGGAGRVTDPFERRWVWTAATAWGECTKKTPSSAADGRFFQALEDFHSRNKGLPKVTARVLRTILIELNAIQK